ncbi:MAG TPA: APC family permease [Gemmatimonadales bacterium]|nr:APC family permease [Gemmatimonadales bacterium]
MAVQPPPEVSPSQEAPTLVRVMGRWTVTALMINAIIGSGIFGLPSVLVRLVGSGAPWAWIVGSVGNAVIVLCFAEVASRFTAAGGAYLYARESLGRLPAIQVGWLTYLTRLSAVAAGANLFTMNLVEFFPAVEREAVRVTVLSLMLVTFALVNYRGVRGGARLSNVFTASKLIPLAVFLAAGTVFLAARGPVSTAVPAPERAEWLQALILVLFGYGGYDNAVLAMGEAKDPRRDAPFALAAAILFLTALYTGVQLLVDFTLPDPAATDRPLADAARVYLGAGGARLLAAGAMLSVAGFLVANFLGAPRLTFALSEHRDAPAWLGLIHPRFRTPYVSILLFAFLVWLLAVIGNFQLNATLSGVTRLFVYGSTCVALVALRRKGGPAAWFPVRGGPVFAALGLAFCALLALRMGWAELKAVLVVSGLALLHWWLVRREKA